MQVDELTRELRRLSVQTGHLSVACLGCGHEHSCSVHGCALIKHAADQLDAMLNTIGDLQLQLQASEVSRSELGVALIATRKELHEVRSELSPVYCRDCIYMHDRGKGAIVCDLMNYVDTQPDYYCSRGQRRE